MKKFKLWVAVDESGDFYVYLGEKPTFDPKFGEWRIDTYHSGSEYIRLGHNTELKVGAEAIKEIEVELPTIGEEEEAPKGTDAYVAVDPNRTVWLFTDKPSFLDKWFIVKGACSFLGYTPSNVRSEDSLCKVHLNIPYEITSEK